MAGPEMVLPFFASVETKSLVINKIPFSPFNADFNQISSVWAKCRYWQAVHRFEFKISYGQ
jgi:hypothetical protein